MILQRIIYGIWRERCRYVQSIGMIDNADEVSIGMVDNAGEVSMLLIIEGTFLSLVSCSTKPEIFLLRCERMNTCRTDTQTQIISYSDCN